MIIIDGKIENIINHHLINWCFIRIMFVNEILLLCSIYFQNFLHSILSIFYPMKQIFKFTPFNFHLSTFLWMFMPCKRSNNMIFFNVCPFSNYYNYQTLSQHDLGSCRFKIHTINYDIFFTTTKSTIFMTTFSDFESFN